MPGPPAQHGGGSGLAGRLSSTSLARRAGTAPHRTLIAIGLSGVVVHMIIVYTALQGLDEVDAANRDVSRIVTAQRYFQDADMAHDAVRADVLKLLVTGLDDSDGLGGRDLDVRALRRDVADYRSDLARVAVTGLPAELEESVTRLRPVQEAYAGSVEALGRLATTDPVAARDALPGFEQDFRELTDRQADVTDAMTREVRVRQEAAENDESSVRWRLILAAVVALGGLLGLTHLLSRLGRSLATLLARERGAAETLQRSLLPDQLPDLPGVGLAARYVAGGVGAEVGGDWYDVIGLPGGEVGLVMGDVVGHDLKAAAVMGQMRHALRAYAADGLPPEDVLKKLNRLSLQHDLGEMATVVYAVLDPAAGTVRIANAGHYPPLLADGPHTRYLEGTPQPPVGAVREVAYESVVYELPPEALLVLYTDGLVERRGSAVDDGLLRLRKLLAGRSGTLGAVSDDVLAGMLGDQPPTDDVALLLVAPQATLGPHLDVLWPARPDRLAVLRRLLDRWLREAGATDEECYEVVVCCSEAVTNAVEHAYGPGEAQFQVTCDLTDGSVSLMVRDWGSWREARGRDRGRGLDLVGALMDESRVEHSDAGTQVWMRRRLTVSSAALDRPSVLS